MKKLNLQFTGLKQSLICAAVLSTFAISAQAADLKVSENTIVKSTPLAERTILKMGSSESVLSDELRKSYRVNMVADKHESQQAIDAKVAKASMVHVNMHDFHGSEERLNAYLGAAFKQNKLMAFENLSLEDEMNFTALPGMPKGDLVLFQSRDHTNGDVLTVYGGTSATITLERNDAGFKDGKSLNQQQIDDMVAQSGQFTPDAEDFNLLTQPVTIEAEKLSQMRGEKLTAALETVTDKIAWLLKHPNGQQSKTLVANATGGAIGYLCPTEAKNEQLCWAAVITNGVYQHIDGNANINVLHHYSVAQYRTDQTTSIAVSPNGSANPNMQVDNDKHRAFYLQSVQSTITPTSTDGLSLWSREPGNENAASTVVSSSGMSYGVSGGVDENGPSMGGSITYSESQSLSTTINDWESATNTPNGVTANWLFDLNKYRSYTDWVDTIFVGKSKIYAVPGISKNGLQFTTEGVWVGAPNRTGLFSVGISTVVKNQERYFKTNSSFGNAWSTHDFTWNHNLTTGGYTFNNNWLKSL